MNIHENKMEARHAYKFDLLSKEQQMRTLKKMEQARRKWAKENKNNQMPAEAEVFSYHRRVKLSREARAIHLFRCFLKGTPYIKVEQKLREHTLFPEFLVLTYLSGDNFVEAQQKEFGIWMGVNND